MSLRFMDSFDHYATAQIVDKWSQAAMTTFLSIVGAGGRNGTSCLELASGNAGVYCTVGFTMAAAHATGIVGFAFKPTSRATTYPFFQVYSGATCHLQLFFDGSGHIIVTNGVGTTLATGTTIISTAVFTYIEFKFTIDDTAGAVEIRLNGSASSECAASGIDTRNGALASFNTILLLGKDGSGNGNTTRWDDLYLCDGAGAAPTNTFLGDVRCEALLPQTDAVAAGSNAGLTPSTGTDHGALVDEATPNDDTDYNSSSTVGVKDTYQYPSLSAAPLVIYGIQPCMRVRKTDAGARTVKHVVRSGGADTDGIGQSPATSYAYKPEIWETDPATGVAWVNGGITAMEVGMKVSA